MKRIIKTKSVYLMIILLVISFVVCFLVGCAPDEVDDKDKKITYEDIYKMETVKSPILTGKNVYKASYGYNLSWEQGYNGFFYQYKQDNVFADMKLIDNAWAGEEAKIDGDKMTSATSSEAVRVFDVPVDGEARIYGRVSLVSGDKVNFQVYINDNKIYDSTKIGFVVDADGVYHTNTVTVSKSDKIKFIVSGNATVLWNPIVDFVMNSEESLHYTADGYFGDVHPFYDEVNKKMYMYYLSTGMEQDIKVEQFTSLLATSGNMINYQPTKMQMDNTNPPETHQYYALGVYKDKDGIFRSCYGRGNYAGASKSTDLLTWSNGAEMYLDEKEMLAFRYRAYFDNDVKSGRDPDIFYDKDTKSYYCIVINYYTDMHDKGNKGLAIYKADENGVYSKTAIKALDCTGRGDPECPQVRKIGNRWYIFYSIYGTGSEGNVGKMAYRVGAENTAIEQINWNSLTEHYLDGGDLHAAQICQVGDMYYMYGWIAYRSNQNVWGGHLNIAREVYQKSDGLLGARCDSYLTNELSLGRVSKLSQSNVKVSNMSVVEDVFTSNGNGKAELEGQYNRNILRAHIDMPLNAQSAGFTITQSGKAYYAYLYRNNGKLYLAVSNNVGSLDDFSWIEIENASTTSFDLKIILDGQFIEAFVNDEYALTAHTTLTNSYYTLGIFANGSNVVFANTDVLKLAGSNSLN